MVVICEVIAGLGVRPPEEKSDVKGHIRENYDWSHAMRIHGHFKVARIVAVDADETGFGSRKICYCYDKSTNSGKSQDASPQQSLYCHLCSAFYEPYDTAEILR